jgi:hypothetical protein
MKKIKSSSSGNEDETEVDVLEMDDEISDEKYLNALREADRYGKKKKILTSQLHKTILI